MKSNKTLKVIATTAIAAAMVAPALPAFASSTYTLAGNPVSVKGNNVIPSLRVVVNVDPSTLTTTGDSVILRFPVGSGAEVPATATVPTTIVNSGDNQISSATITPNASTQSTVVDANGNSHTIYREFTLKVTGINTNSSQKGLAYVDFTNVFAPSSVSGPVNLTADAANGSAFNSGNLTIATIGSGSVATSIDDTNSIQDGTAQPLSTIRVKEDVPGGLVTSNSSVKYKLPSGFAWNSNSVTSASVTNVYTGTTASNVSLSIDPSDNRTLILKNTGGSPTTAGYYAISGLKVDVSDDTVAKTGDVVATISGDSSLSNSSLTIGTYGTYGSAVTVTNPPALTAGKDDQNFGRITIKENAAGTFIDGRTIQLSLSGNAKWATDANGNLIDAPQLDSGLSDQQGVTINGGWTKVGTDGSTIQATVKRSATTSKPATLVFSTTTGGIDVAADAAAQDVTLTVGGTAGASGTGKLATIVPPVSGKTDADPTTLAIGTQGQALPALLITEAKAGAINNDKGQYNLELKFPRGVTPSLPGQVSVTAGDISLNTANVSKQSNTDGTYSLFIPVKSTSSTPSTISVSGVKVDVDRTVAEGPLKVDVKGNAIVRTAAQFPGSTKVTSIVVGNVATPAPTDTTASNIVFKLGSTSYTVNGKTMTMDAQPLVKWERAFLPIRFAANALNVTDNNIIWDDATNTATIFKGATVITARVGDYFLTVNGTKVSMPVPVYRDKAATNNRVMIPIRYLSNALGSNIVWNQSTGEITIGAK